MTDDDLIVDLCAGPGGWDEGLLLLGKTNVVGIETDDAACATRAAAGHRTLQGDIATLDPLAVLASWNAAACEAVIGSPPCPTFSQAGNRLGMLELPYLLEHVHACAQRGWFPYVAPESVGEDEEFGEPIRPDPRSGLVLEPLRWIGALHPRWVALEQVPPVLPIWEAMATTLRTWGYSTWAGELNAADYGVPQTRRRVFMMANRERAVAPPRTYALPWWCVHVAGRAQAVGLHG